MDFCDIDSDKWLQYSRDANFPMKQIYRSENLRLQSYEKKIYKAFDFSTVVTEQEKKVFKKVFSQAEEVIVIPNGVDTVYFSPAPIAEPPVKNDNHTLVYTGAMDYHANVDAVCWFCREIFPQLQTGFPGLQFYIVGRYPDPAVKKLDSLTGVHVIGDVEDIRPWYQKADVFVVPLRLGRGVPNKVLEAMAMGRAIVTTSMANAGIRAVHKKDLVIADSSVEFKASVAYLLENIEERTKLEKNARQFVIENFNWEKNMKMFEKLLV